MGKNALTIFSASLSVTLIHLLLVWWHYGNVSAEVPLHINFEGQIDHIGSKSKLWYVPALSMVLLLVLFLLARKPEALNYGTELNEFSAKKMYLRMQHFLACLSLLISSLFLLTLALSFRVVNLNNINNFVFITLFFIILILPILTRYIFTRS